jgi:hypothetical protein
MDQTTIVYMRGRATLAIMSETAHLRGPSDKIIIVARPGDALAEPGDQIKEEKMTDITTPAIGEPHPYEMWDDCGNSAEISASSIDEALAQAIEWVRAGDWDLDGETGWVRVRVRDLATGAGGSATVAIDPEEPPCIDDEHDWQSPHEIVGGIEDNPGVWLNGGGVIIEEVCMRCGCGRRTDTWAQDPSTGEQGLTSVSYTPGEFTEELRELELEDGEEDELEDGEEDELEDGEEYAR